MKEIIPQIFHAHHIRHNKDITFWLGLAREVGDPILELGCGTGRVLACLAQAGYRVFGLDREAGMLSFLRDNYPSEILSSVHIFLADMSAFHLARQFPLIILPCNTFSTLNANTRKETLAHIYRHLSTNGVFAVGLPNPAQLKILPPFGMNEVEETIDHPLSGNPVQISSEWEKTGENFLLRWHYDHLYPDGRVERLTIETCHDLASTSTYLAELHTVGLIPKILFGDYNRSAYKSSSPNLIIQCQKILI